MARSGLNAIPVSSPTLDSHPKTHSLNKRTPMNRMLGSLLLALAVCTCAALADEPAKDAFIPLFDGKSLDGWEKVGNQDSVWEVKDGAICGSGPASMLVCTKGPYKNFRYRAEIKINDGGNSG